MQNVLFLFNTAPYQNELVFNGLRLATQMLKQEQTIVRMFFQSEAVYAAMKGHNPPHLKFRTDTMIAEAMEGGATVGLCGVCMDARAVTDEMLVEGAKRSTMMELADWTTAADKVLVF